MAGRLQRRAGDTNRGPGSSKVLARRLPTATTTRRVCEIRRGTTENRDCVSLEVGASGPSHNFNQSRCPTDKLISWRRCSRATASPLPPPNCLGQASARARRASPKSRPLKLRRSRGDLGSVGLSAAHLHELHPGHRISATHLAGPQNAGKVLLDTATNQVHLVGTEICECLRRRDGRAGRGRAPRRVQSARSHRTVRPAEWRPSSGQSNCRARTRR